MDGPALASASVTPIPARDARSSAPARRMGVLLALGFASGLPATLVDTLQTWATAAGLDKSDVAKLSLLALPFALKFVWAPLLDRYRTPLLGRRRLGWGLLVQVLLLAAILGVSFADPVHALTAFVVLGAAIAFLSATQDIALDAYRADLLTDADRGPGTSAWVGAYRMAMVAGGAGVIALATTAAWGFGAAFRATAGLLGIGILACLVAPRPDREMPPAPSLREAVLDPFRELVTRRRGLLVLLFVLLFRVPDPLAASVTVPFLNRAVGLPISEIGAVRGGVGVVAGIVGALAGGFVVKRLGLRRSLWVVGVLQAASNLGFWVLAHTGPDRGVFVGVALFESFCNGLTAAAFIAYLITQCDARHTGTQIALFTSLAVVAGRLTAWYGGDLVDAFGWDGFFVLSAVVGVPGMLLIPWLAIPEDGTAHRRGAEDTEVAEPAT